MKLQHKEQYRPFFWRRRRLPKTLQKTFNNGQVSTSSRLRSTQGTFFQRLTDHDALGRVWYCLYCTCIGNNWYYCALWLCFSDFLTWLIVPIVWRGWELLTMWHGKRGSGYWYFYYGCYRNDNHCWSCFINGRCCFAQAHHGVKIVVLVDLIGECLNFFCLS